jgi:nitroreductase
MIRDLVLKNRSYRLWRQEEAIEYETLKEFVDLARLCSSAANRQALKYIISNDSNKNALIFPYLHIDNDPVEGERAAAYIVILEDQRIKMAMPCDFGITAQTIMLAAVEKGLGGVMIGAIYKIGLRKAMELPSHLEILLVLALGKTIEQMIIAPMGKDGNTQQWWETKEIRHVPKRALEDIIVDYPPLTKEIPNPQYQILNKSQGPDR